MTNSSPPSRAAVSPSRIARPKSLADGDQQGVAGLVAIAVVDRLEVVEVDEQHGELRPPGDGWRSRPSGAR